MFSGGANEVEQCHFVALAASATARSDGLAAFDAVDFDSAVVPSIDVDSTEIRHRFIRHRAGVSPALAYFQSPQGAWNQAY